MHCASVAINEPDNTSIYDGAQNCIRENLPTKTKTLLKPMYRTKRECKNKSKAILSTGSNASWGYTK